MLLNERSPINAKIRTKSAELLMLRKIEAIEIYSLYPNIWKRINKISLHNMGQIYLKIRKYVIKFAKMNNIDINKFINKRVKDINVKQNAKKNNLIQKTIHNELNNNYYKNEKNENGNEKRITVESKKGLNNNDIINIFQPPKTNCDEIQIKTKVLNLTKKDDNLTNIKSYFQNISDIYKEKVLNTTDTKYIIKED